ncbi:MAG TPA: TMEM165/GDT1 family protein [Thermoanaerobaculia bacterium]|jgi:putative Ca2+/H+ antiporter (TMEM165/GDT1 family)|nr:TMEM165/GDT1 family protein [Thermoanaerobaculia bacterium]
MAWRDLTAYLLLSYWTVLVAELIGDRSIYTVTSLAMRFRPGVVYCGITVAFMGKMLVAVLFGRLLGHLPPTWTSAVSAASFFATAICIAFKRRGEPRPEPEVAPAWRNVALVSFLAIFFSEWADFGQISAAALVTRTNAPLAIWLGGSLALCTKGALAMTLGLHLRRRIPLSLARALATASCLILGLTSLYDLLPR